jgi:hypothetical protein
MALKAARTSDYTPMWAFGKRLFVVVVHKLNILSTYPQKYKDEDGVEQERDAYQHLATVIPLESGEAENDEGTKKVSFTAGEVHRVFIGGTLTRSFKKEDINDPIVGRLVKGKPNKHGGKAWKLQPPTEAEYAQAENFPDIDALVTKAIEDQAERDREFAERARGEVASPDDIEDDDPDEDAPRAPYKR